MKLFPLFLSIALAAATLTANGADADPKAPTSSPIATHCITLSIRNLDAQPFVCKGLLGKFTSINEFYERGYRVVSSVILNEPGGPVMIIIEKRG